MTDRRILSFLALAFGFSWTLAGVGFLFGIRADSGLSYVLLAALAMFGPAIAAIVQQRLIDRESWSGLGIALRGTRWAVAGLTALLGEAAAHGRGEDLADVRTAPYDGLTGEREPGKIGFASLRAGGIIGEHTVLFASEDETLTLSHSAIDRSLFARGAVAAAAWVRSRTPGLYDMQDVLGFRQA